MQSAAIDRTTQRHFAIIADNASYRGSRTGHGGDVFLVDSLMAGHSDHLSGDPDDCSGMVSSGGYDLIGDVPGFTVTGIDSPISPMSIRCWPCLTVTTAPR